MDAFEKFKKDFGILVEAGFVAVKHGDEDSATKLFLAAQTLKPEHTAPKLGFGYISLSKLELDDATKTFQDIVTEEPKNYLATIFLGLSLMLSRKNIDKGNKMVNKVLEETEDPSLQHFAQTVLAWKEEFFAQEKAKA
jgi:hypothetical protein